MPLVDADGGGILIMNLYPVCSQIYPVTVRVPRDNRTAGTDIPATVTGMPFWNWA